MAHIAVLNIYTPKSNIARARNAHARLQIMVKNGCFRSHIRETMFLGFGCFRFANIKVRVNVQK